MKRSFFFLFFSMIILAGILSGCVPKTCTSEAHICPDGSSVGRNHKNNCEFDPCPTTESKCGNNICEENEYVPCPKGAQCIWAGSCPQDCEEEQKDFWCGNKHYQIEDAKCEVIDPQPGYTCIDTDKGAILVPLSEETDTRNCVNGGNNQ